MTQFFFALVFKKHFVCDINLQKGQLETFTVFKFYLQTILFPDVIFFDSFNINKLNMF
jgi:hypothetical protein